MPDQPPPAPAPPPPPAGSPHQPPPGSAAVPDASWIQRNPVLFAALLVGGVLALLIVVAIAAAILVPVFLAQSTTAAEAELSSAARNAALEVEAAATATGGDYAAVGDLAPLVDRGLEHSGTTGVVALDAASSATFATRDAFSLCFEHAELPGSVTYASAGGGLGPYDESPCP